MKLAICSFLLIVGVYNLSPHGFSIYFLLTCEDDTKLEMSLKKKCQSQAMLLFCFVILISREPEKKRTVRFT